MVSFNKYNFNQDLLKSIEELGFNKPTPIQDKVIPQTKLYRYETLSGNVIIELKYDIPCVSNTEREEIELEFVNRVCNFFDLTVKNDSLTTEEEEKLFDRGKKRLMDKDWQYKAINYNFGDSSYE